MTRVGKSQRDLALPRDTSIREGGIAKKKDTRLEKSFPSDDEGELETEIRHRVVHLYDNIIRIRKVL